MYPVIFRSSDHALLMHQVWRFLRQCEENGVEVAAVGEARPSGGSYVYLTVHLEAQTTIEMQQGNPYLDRKGNV